jgi:perosamine synthetase
LGESPIQSESIAVLAMLLLFQPAYARKRIDITWSILVTFIYNTLFHSQTPAQIEEALDTLWAPHQTHTAYTVRSGFDLCLLAYAFPTGSEIIISAITVPSIPHLTRLHGLVPIPVDVQADGSVSASDVAALITPRTRALVVAHLFGNRMDMNDIMLVAKEHDVVVLEDCAEAFAGKQWTGCEMADVSLFSFGGIKTCTALGGALLTVRDATLLPRMKKLQEGHPQQSNLEFGKRVLKYSLFKLLTDSKYLYGLLLAVLSVWGMDHHVLIRRWSRSFRDENLLPQIRKRPASALLLLLHQRIINFEMRSLEERKKRVEDLAARLPQGIRPVAFGQENHRYWLCPIRVPRPEVLVKSLYEAGFDAADGGTSLAVVSSVEDVKPEMAEKMMAEIVYLPVDHVYDNVALDRIASDVWRHHEKYGLRGAGL